MTNAVQTFGDLVNRFGDSSRSDAEVAAIVAELLNSGRAQLHGQRAGRRIVVRPSLDAFLQWVRAYSSQQGERKKDAALAR